jgi:hypothetical protein
MIDLVKDPVEALPRDPLRRLVMPIATAIQEAHDLLELCRGPIVSAALEEVGMRPGFVDDLALRVQAARDAQSAWIAVRYRAKPAELLALENRAVALRRRMLAAGRFSLRGIREAQVALEVIRGGAGVDDLVQDLFDLAVVFRKYAVAFDADRSFDVDASVLEARALGRRLSLAVSEARLGTAATVTRELRDRAFSSMAELVAEIRLAGRYAYRDDAESARLFASRFLRKRRARRRRGADATSERIDATARADGAGEEQVAAA